MKKRFIFVTGHPRSGTTFVGKMLAIPKSVQYFSEPFNPEYGMVGIKQYFSYIGEQVDDLSKHNASVIDKFYDGKAKFKNLSNVPAKSKKQKLGRILFGTKNNFEYKNFWHNPYINTGIIKDPTINLSADYFAKNKNTPVVVVIRHPASMIASCKRLGMNHRIKYLQRQQELNKDYLTNFVNHYSIHQVNAIQDNAYHWLFINQMLLNYSKRSKNIILITHEKISLNPIKEFEKLYQKLDLHFTPKIKLAIKESTSSKNPTAPPNNAMHHLKRNSKENINRWKSILTKQEISQIKEITYDFASNFYDDKSWD